MKGILKLEPTEFLTDKPRFPDFPFAEWERRIKRAKELMSESGVDVLVLWKRENIRYFFGFQTTHWEMASIQPAVGIITLDKEPCLIVPDMLSGNAQIFGWCREIWYQPDAHHVTKERELPKDVALLLKEMGYGNKRIALEMGPLGVMYIPRPLNDIEVFKSELSSAKFVNGDKVIWGCRMIKSPFEIERIRQASTVITRCHSEIVEKFRPGMSEMDIGKIIYHAQVESNGFQGGDTSVVHHICCNIEKEGAADILAIEGAPIDKAYGLSVDLQHKYKGYWADIARLYQVGEITDRIKRNYALCAEGLENAAAIVRPGVRASELYNAALKPVMDAGLPIHIRMAGHGIGLDVHEPPSIDPTNDMLIEEGMVFSLEVWLTDGLKRHGGEGTFGLEDQYVCTSKGYEKIEGLRKDIIKVTHPIC